MSIKRVCISAGAALLLSSCAPENGSLEINNSFETPLTVLFRGVDYIVKPGEKIRVEDIPLGSFPYYTTVVVPYKNEVDSLGIIRSIPMEEGEFGSGLSDTLFFTQRETLWQLAIFGVVYKDKFEVYGRLSSSKEGL